MRNLNYSSVESTEYNMVPSDKRLQIVTTDRQIEKAYRSVSNPAGSRTSKK